MSCLNVLLYHNLCAVSTDTGAYKAGSTEITSFSSKSTYYPHIRTLVSFVGNSVICNILNFLFSLKRNKTNDSSIDTVVNILPEMLESAIKLYLVLPENEVKDEAWHCAVVISGYSEAKKRCAAYICEVDGKDTDYTIVEINPGSIRMLPVIEYKNAQRFLTDAPSAFIDLAKCQRREFNSGFGGKWPVGTIGGDLHLSVIEKDKFEQRTIFSWNDKIAKPVKAIDDSCDEDELIFKLFFYSKLKDVTK